LSDSEDDSDVEWDEEMLEKANFKKYWKNR